MELAWQILGESQAPLPLARAGRADLRQLYPTERLGCLGAGRRRLVLSEGGRRRARPGCRRRWRARPASASPGRGRPNPGRISWSAPGKAKSTRPDDARYLRETEELAFGRRKESRLLSELGRSERPETAHALLLEWGCWDGFKNPYPSRLGISLVQPTLELPDLPEETRLDLTSLPAFAIDDRDNQDPDDALSLVECRLEADGKLVSGRLWVHVADAAALAPPDSPLDLEARQRGATFYLPEGAVTMLPQAAIQRLGLGLQEISPALSFEIELDAGAQPRLVQVQPSLVRVQRLSYDQVELQLEAEPFRSLNHLAQAYQGAARQTAL